MWSIKMLKPVKKEPAMKIAKLSDLLTEAEMAHITGLIDLNKDNESQLITEIKKYLNSDPHKYRLLEKGVYPDYLAHVLVFKVRNIIQ
jgi:hypothetical protein